MLSFKYISFLLFKDIMDMVVDDPKTAIQQELPHDQESGKTEDMGGEIGHIKQEPSRVLADMDKHEEPSFDLSKASEELSGDVGKTKEPGADVDEVICIDVEVENDDLQVFFIYCLNPNQYKKK